jgi:hypothetical protein
VRLRLWCAITGAIIALPLAYAVGMTAALWATLATLAILGFDTNYPQWAEAIVAGTGLLAGAAIVALGVFAGYRFGRGQESSVREPLVRVAAGTLAALVVGGTLAYSLTRPVEPPARPSAPVADERSPALIRLDAERHKVQVLNATAGDMVRINILSEGARAGDYRLRVQVGEQVYRKVLVATDEVVTLPAGPYESLFEVESQTVGQAYAAKILNANPGDVQVEENFVVSVTLEPKLTEDELAALSAGERERQARGGLDLASRARTEYVSRLLIIR